MRKLPRGGARNFFPLTVFFIVILVGIDMVVTLRMTNSEQGVIYSDILGPLLGSTATAFLFIAAKESAFHSKRLAFAWGLIAASILAFTLGDVSWAILELGLNEWPFPSIADVFYLANYPLLLIGALLLPERPATQGERISQVLDAAVIMVAATLGFWNFLMGPVIAVNADLPRVEQAILLAYPVGDLVLLWALLRIIYRHPDQQNETPALLLAASLAVTILADSVFTYQSLAGTYVSGGLLDIWWRLSCMLAGQAGIAQIGAIQTLKRTGKFPHSRRFSGWKAIAPYFPYLWLIAAYILLIQSQFISLQMDFLSLAFAVGGVICLVLLRQIITLSENKKLNTQLQETMETLQTQATELELANEDFQNEIVERRAVEQQLTYDSLHDAMTGLPNRVLFLDRLGQAIEYCKRREEYTFAVLFVDIDHFKVINDSLGHLAGDQLLISIGRRMKEGLRSSDTVARLGGDEFAVLLEITGEKNCADQIAEKLQKSIKLPFNLNGHELYVTASIGIVMSVDRYAHPDEVLRDADIAMYQAKALGKARFEVFDVKMRSHAFSRLEMEQALRAALENEEFQLYYQPILSMKSGQVASFEALIRWNHPTRGLLLPGEFLDVADESGLILPIEKWVLNEACAQLQEWHQKYPGFKNVSMNVNVSNQQFSQPNFVADVVEALQTNKLRPESLKLEITEMVLISNYAAANQIFTQFRDMGVQLQIDDFGSGYSSLGHLQHLPISAVKIDKSFVDEMGKDRRGIGLIRAIVSMTRELGMEAIAEGIETGEQLDALKELACNFGQGFLLSRPLDRDGAEKMLGKRD